MAIYHFSAKMISRSTGRSAVAAAAYRTAERIEDHRQGLEHDYSNRTGVLHTEILAPESTPEALRDRATLWNAVEQVERRKDAQLAREVTVALPHELTDAQRASLVRSFVQSAFVDRGMIADVAKEHRLTERNPTFRGNLLVTEGTQSDTAILSQSDGILLQELPFAVELK